jgi:hypothetical protein
MAPLYYYRSCNNSYFYSKLFAIDINLYDSEQASAGLVLQTIDL